MLLLAGPQAPANSIRRDVPRDSSHVARSIVDEAGDAPALGPNLGLMPAGRPSIRVVAAAQGASAGSGPAYLGMGAGPIAPLPTIYEVTIQPGTGFNEKFLFQETVAPGPRPLLVVFHKYGVGHYDAYAHTSFFDEARRRGWYCLAPISSSQAHFSNLLGQVHSEAAIDWAFSQFQIDARRVYGVGFSMGGGAAMNYAARHLDPGGAMFAAVFNISGIASLEDAYAQEPAIRGIFDSTNWFGNGSPGSAEALRMRRSSLIGFDPFTFVVDASSDQARNLMHITTRTALASGDIPYLLNQNSILNAHLQSLGALPGQHDLFVYQTPPLFHSWDLLPERTVCDWLRPQRLDLPTTAITLADHDDRYFYFDVVQEVPNTFTSFQWKVLASLNRVDLVSTTNLERATFDTSFAGLSVNQPLAVTLNAADGLADEFRLLGWSFPPSAVLRDGVPAVNWSHDAGAGRVSLFESDAATHNWTIFP